ncbi:MAG TPA: hypothetical protein VGM81_01455 [Burkholderiaceae bacterium]|jgi:hypothetical protein
MLFLKLGSSAVLAAALLGLTGPAAGAVAKPAAAMNQIVETRLAPQLEYLVEHLAVERKDMRLDGVSVFDAGDKFLPGKIALGIGDLIEIHARTAPDRVAHDVETFHALADITVGMDNHTWGIYYYLLALHKLEQAGLLERAVAPDTLTKLRAQLDWRNFVRPDLTLIDLPTNYYGVAFGVARLRFLLGWEDDSGSKRLLERLLAHYRQYSGSFGFSDETDGEGRFDRYSILLVAELCERLTETGLPVPDELKPLLRRSADIALDMANDRGEGFAFGRSLGPYGDTAPLEILTAAASADVLTPDERAHAYAYAGRISARYADFWFDPTIHSVDLWNHGRGTDTYRAKHRILGENLSLLHQFFAANARWNATGWQDREPPADLDAWVQRTQPGFKFVWFARGEYDRALALVRDGTQLFSLLLVNGGAGQHANSPYYPLPFAQGLIAGTPDSGSKRIAQLLPRFELDDGAVLMPAAFFKNIESREADGARIVSVHQDALARQGSRSPQADPRIAVETTYRFEAGRIVRIDRFTPKAPLHVHRLSLDFASFSDAPQLDGNVTHFGQGRVQSFAVEGAGTCQARPADAKDRSPEGPMHSRIHCERRDFDLQEPLTVTWTMSYH